jgi:uncharacterized protein (DUF608 family)
MAEYYKQGTRKEVVYSTDDESKGVVMLGWGRGKVQFEKDPTTDEITWIDPSEDARVSQILISRAKAIYKKVQN